MSSLSMLILLLLLSAFLHLLSPAGLSLSLSSLLIHSKQRLPKNIKKKSLTNFVSLQIKSTSSSQFLHNEQNWSSWSDWVLLTRKTHEFFVLSPNLSWSDALNFDVCVFLCWAGVHHRSWGIQVSITALRRLLQPSAT